MKTNRFRSATGTIPSATAAVIGTPAAAYKPAAHLRSAFAAGALAASLGLLLVTVPLAPASATPILELSYNAVGYATQYVISTPGNLIGFVGSYAGYSLNISGYGDQTGINFTTSITNSPTLKPNLTVSLTETGLPAGSGSVADLVDSNTAQILLAGNSTKVTFNANYDTTDTLFGTQHLFATSSVTGPGSFSNVFEDIFPISAPFSITATQVLSPIKGKVSGATSSISVTMPEPLSLALFGPAVVALVLVRRFGRRQTLRDC